jgi:hypothetical protein
MNGPVRTSFVDWAVMLCLDPTVDREGDYIHCDTHHAWLAFRAGFHFGQLSPLAEPGPDELFDAPGTWVPR